MSSLPSATVRMTAQSGSSPSNTDLIAVWGCCATLADSTPRLYSSSSAMMTAHGYCDAVEYAALHMEGTDKPILFMPLPISTAGTVGRFNATGNTGSSVVTCAVGGSGALTETDGVLSVLTGGTVGTDQIILGLSLDGGDTVKPVRLGTASSYTIQNVGLVLSFAAGTLVTGDTVLTWHSTAPTPDWTSLTTALAAMEAQQLVTRSWLCIGDLTALNQAQGIATAAATYETTGNRFVLAKAQMRDRLPVAVLSQVQNRASGIFTTSFDGTAHTITRSFGSFTSDGFASGDTIRVSGSTADNGNKGVPSSVAATVLTFASGLTTEGPDSGVTITAEPTLVFASSGHTITRNRGSWLDDGFRVGDSVTATGTASNNATLTITALTPTVMTFGSGVVNETIGSIGVAMSTGETATSHTATMDALVASVTNAPRVDLGIGRLTKLSPITGYTMRRPVQWADSIRSYQNDLAVTTWWKELGPLAGWGIEGERDERTDGGGITARFTCARTWGNGPNGAFIAKSVTRALDDSVLALTHNVYVANLAQTVIQKATEGWAGRTLVLNADGTATPRSLAVLNQKANEELRRNLLTDVSGQGPRASVAKWIAHTDDILNGPDATLNGDLDLEVNGTLVHINTNGKVR